MSCFVTQRNFANFICNVTYLIHYLCGGNPNPVKTFLSVIGEIISHYFLNGQHFEAVLKFLVVANTKGCDYYSHKTKINNKCNELLRKNVCLDSVEYKYLVACVSAIRWYELAHIHNSWSRVIELPKSLYGINDFIPSLAALSVNQEN